jgi:hypothetical protein
VVSVLSAEVASVLTLVLSGDYCAEAVVGGLHGSVHKGKLSDVVLVNHAENGLLLLVVHLGVLDFLLVRRLQLPEAVVGDQTKSLLLGATVDSAKGSWDSARAKAVDVWLFLTFLNSRQHGVRKRLKSETDSHLRF